MKPVCIYDITASWADNLQQGPQWPGAVPDRQLPPPTEWIDFLGHKVRICTLQSSWSPLGLCPSPCSSQKQGVGD